MSLERYKPFARIFPANSLSLSILMRDVNQLMINVFADGSSLDFYERRKPFASHMKTGL